MTPTTYTPPSAAPVITIDGLTKTYKSGLQAL